MTKKKLLFSLAGLIFFLFLATPVLAVSLELSSPISDFKVNEEFWLEIDLNLQSQETLGTDVILTFNSEMLEATGVEEGDLYSSYPGKKIDNDRGRIYLSGATSYGKPMSQSGILGKVGFLAKTPGETKVSFDWQAGKTSDTNVVPYEGYEDLLQTKPDDFTLTIKKLSFWEKIIAFIKKIILP